MEYPNNVDELLKINPIKDDKCDTVIVEKYLSYFSTLGAQRKIDTYFKSNLSNEILLLSMFEILLDNSDKYNSNARIGAAFYIGKFDKDLLLKYKDKVLTAQKNEEDIFKPFRNFIPEWLK